MQNEILFLPKFAKRSGSKHRLIKLFEKRNVYDENMIKKPVFMKYFSCVANDNRKKQSFVT